MTNHIELKRYHVALKLFRMVLAETCMEPMPYHTAREHYCAAAKEYDVVPGQLDVELKQFSIVPEQLSMEPDQFNVVPEQHDMEPAQLDIVIKLYCTVPN